MGRAGAPLVVLLVLAATLYLAYRWLRNHPETVRRAVARLGGERLQAFLRGPVGLWIRRRLSPHGAYGLALSVGLVLLGLFSWAFGGIVQDVVARDPLVRVDVAILRFFHSHSEPYLTFAVGVLETVFSPEVLLVAAVLIGALLVFLARRRGGFGMGFSGVVLLATALGTAMLSGLFELVFHRPRPPASLRLVAETGDSFPSGHAVTALVLGATLCYLFSLRSPESRGGSWRAKARVGLAVVGVVLLVGFGRVYTGAHYPSDVLAGWALGGVWASVCLTSAEIFRRLRAGGKSLSETGVRYAQFSLVGISNALVDLGTLNLLLLIHPTRTPALLVLYNLVALALTNANSYLWNTLWTFRHRARHDARQVGLFTAQGLLNAGVGSGVLWLTAHWLGAYPGISPQIAGNVAKVVSMVVASTLSFLFLRYFVFHRK